MIRIYKKEDKKEIFDIIYYFWNIETNLKEELKVDIYNFLLNYYNYNNNTSYVSYSDKIDAFLFTYNKDEKNESIINYKKALNKYDDKTKEEGIKYLKYLEYNSKKVLNYVNDNDMIFGLLASIKHDEGPKLMNYATMKAKNLGYKNAYFWTDETCNYKFYNNEKYKLVEVYTQLFYGKIIKTFIYKIEL